MEVVLEILKELKKEMDALKAGQRHIIELLEQSICPPSITTELQALTRQLGDPFLAVKELQRKRKLLDKTKSKYAGKT